MLDVKNGADVVPILARDAAEWFVENGSDREVDEETVLQWEEWCTSRVEQRGVRWHRPYVHADSVVVRADGCESGGSPQGCAC